MSLKNKARSGILWSIVEQFSVKFISLVISLILARILSPSEFGLIAMLSVFLAIGTSLMESGLTSSLIRTQNADQQDYSTVFFFNLMGALVVYAILFIFAPLIASFYHQPLLAGIVRLYGISIIISALFSVQNTLLTKDMKFKAQTIIQIPSVLIGGCLGILLAKLGYGVWSIVWMNLLNNCISTILHWYISPWRPIFIFNRTRFKYHFQFGYKMTISGMLDTLYKNIYTIIIGRFFAATQLGFYSRAESLSQLPVNIISASINKVTYPMFSMISDDDVKLKMVYKKLMQQVLFWNAPILILLALVAHPLIQLLLTSKWLPSVPYFQILCLSGILYPLHAYNLNILKVKGRSDQFLKLEVIKKVLGVIGIVCVIPFGIYGLLYYQFFFTILAYYINSFYSGRLINYPVKEQLYDILPILGLAAGLGIVCYFTDRWYVHHFQVTDLFRVIGIAVIYGGFYLGISNLVKITAIADFKTLILRI